MMVRATRNTTGSIRLSTSTGSPVLEVRCRPGLSIPRVEVRPLRHGDAGPLLHVFDGMSAESRHARFLVPTPRLPATVLRLLTDVDHWHHGCWVVYVEGEAVGAGRYVRLAADPEVAEVALEVADAFQGLGIGALLVEVLAVAAADVGVRQLSAAMGHENRAARRLSDRYGGRPALRDGLLEGQIPVPQVGEGTARPIVACASMARARRWRDCAA
jgi:GNAT superfamily N-acetyltransferase